LCLLTEDNDNKPVIRLGIAVRFGIKIVVVVTHSTLSSFLTSQWIFDKSNTSGVTYEAVNQRTTNTMTKKKKEQKRQTMIYKTLHRKQRINLKIVVVVTHSTLSSFLTSQWIFDKSNTSGVTNEAGTAYHSGAFECTPGFL
jgi:mannitol-specific phosphotransferase system IIBC component